MDPASGPEYTNDPSEMLICHFNSSVRSHRRNPRKPIGVHTRRPLTWEETSASVRPVPRIFKPVLPSGCVSVFDGI